MSTHTIAEFCYILASAAVTWFITWCAAWGYPQGQATIWPIGLVSMAFVVGMGLKPFLESWRADHVRRPGT